MEASSRFHTVSRHNILHPARLYSPLLYREQLYFSLRDDPGMLISMIILFVMRNKLGLSSCTNK